MTLAVRAVLRLAVTVAILSMGIALAHGPSFPPDPWIGGGTGTTCNPSTDPHCP